jgi:hypothetical protein
MLLLMESARAKVTRNRIQDHFHFYAHYDMPRDTVATRRIPCSCPTYHVQITMPWIQNVPLTQQDRFKKPDNCLLGNEFGDFNSWKIVELKLAAGCLEEDEINECTDDALAVIEAAMIPLIKFIMFGAISCDNDKEGAPDGYYLVRYTDIPFVLQEPSRVEGCNGGDMPKGTTVVEGRYWNRVPRSPHWFQEGKYDDPKLLFHVQHNIYWIQISKWKLTINVMVTCPQLIASLMNKGEGPLPSARKFLILLLKILGLRKKEGMNWTMLRWNSRRIQAMMRMTRRRKMRRRKRRRNSTYM